MKKIFIILSLCFQYSLLLGQLSELSPKTGFYFKSDLTIGHNQTDVRLFFGLPSAVLSDSTGRIIVSDDKYGAIRIFSEEGEFIKEFGRPGKGPGEFTEVTSMTLLPDGDLLIFDFFQQRFTKYSIDGAMQEVIPAPKGVEIKPDYMRAYGRTIFMFYRFLSGKNGTLSPDKDFLFHEIPSDLSRINKHVIPITHTIDTSSPFELYFEGGAYRGIFTFSDSSLFVAPFFYRGKILKYSASSEWELEEVLKGYVQEQKTYELYDDPKKVIGKGYITNSAKYGKLYGIMNNESLGLFLKSSGELVHIGLLKIDDASQLYISIFDQGGRLVKHGPVSNLTAGLQGNGYYRRLRFYWMDARDRLYIIDHAENGFVIHRGTLEESD